MNNILVVTGCLHVGGLEKVAVSCMKYANREKCHFTFLVLSNKVGKLEEDVKKMGGDIIHMRYEDNPIKHVQNLYRIMKTNGPFDIIHSHVFFNSGLVLLAAKMAGIKVRIAHSHSIRRQGIGLNKVLFNNVMRLLLQSCATKVCACSGAAGGYVFGKGYYARHGVLVPNIVDIERFRFNEAAKNKVREELGVNEDEVLLGQVGNLAPAKNQIFLLDMFKSYHDSHKSKLLIVGEGVMRAKIEKKIRSLHLEDSVILTGTRTDVPDLLSAMDVFVCTSTNEGLGIVLLEAQANGLPCVCEENAIVDEIKQLGNSFFVCDFKNHEKWIEAIDNSLSKRNSPEIINAVMNSPFTIEKLTDVISNLYNIA